MTKTTTTTKNRFPLLTAVVEETLPNGEEVANDQPFDLRNTGIQGELKTMLEEGLIPSDGGEHSSPHHDTYLMFGGQLRFRATNGLVVSARDEARSNEHGSFFVEVTGTPNAPWWAALRTAVKDALAKEETEAKADKSVLANTWSVG